MEVDPMTDSRPYTVSVIEIALQMMNYYFDLSQEQYEIQYPNLATTFT